MSDTGKFGRVPERKFCPKSRSFRFVREAHEAERLPVKLLWERVRLTKEGGKSTRAPEKLFQLKSTCWRLVRLTMEAGREAEKLLLETSNFTMLGGSFGRGPERPVLLRDSKVREFSPGGDAAVAVAPPETRVVSCGIDPTKEFSLRTKALSLPRKRIPVGMGPDRPAFLSCSLLRDVNLEIAAGMLPPPVVHPGMTFKVYTRP